MRRPANKLRPVHPGKLLADELHELGLTARAFAAALKVPHNRISAILNGQRGISADTAASRYRYALAKLHKLLAEEPIT